jgi:acylphosphatase
MRHYNITISGKVQGCYFRASAKAKAEQLGIAGMVQNLPSGEVYVEVEGNDETLEEFIQWCQHGPAYAQVKDIDLEETDVRGLKGFEVKR